jgi:hypothetical protein
MVLFPSYVPHMVFPHNGRSARISIAFNLRADPSSPVPMLAAAAPPPCTRCSKPKLNGLDPQLDLTDDLAGIADHPARQIAELLPMALASC